MIPYLFGLGLLSSLHCVGMCLPLHTMVLSSANGQKQFFVDNAFYHTGRILVYGLLGLVISLLNILVYVMNWQVIILTIVGVLLTYVSIKQLLGKKLKNSSWQSYLYLRANKLIRFNQKIGLFSLGAVNGLLPCGLVYTAMALSFLNHKWYEGVIGMMAFGIGTLPLLIALLFSSNKLKLKKYLNTSIIEPMFGVIVGIFMIYKAIVFVAPTETQLWYSVINPILCH